MALRLIEMILPATDGDKVRELLEVDGILEQQQVRLLEEKVLVRILLEAEQSERVLDLLEKRYPGLENNRLVMLPVQATLPREGIDMAVGSEQQLAEEKPLERIDREELYEGIKDAALCSSYWQ